MTKYILTSLVVMTASFSVLANQLSARSIEGTVIRVNSAENQYLVAVQDSTTGAVTTYAMDDLQNLDPRGSKLEILKQISNEGGNAEIKATAVGNRITVLNSVSANQ